MNRSSDDHQMSVAAGGGIGYPGPLFGEGVVGSSDPIRYDL